MLRVGLKNSFRNSSPAQLRRLSYFFTTSMLSVTLIIVLANWVQSSTTSPQDSRLALANGPQSSAPVVDELRVTNSTWAFFG